MEDVQPLHDTSPPRIPERVRLRRLVRREGELPHLRVLFFPKKFGKWLSKAHARFRYRPHARPFVPPRSSKKDGHWKDGSFGRKRPQHEHSLSIPKNKKTRGCNRAAN